MELTHDNKVAFDPISHSYLYGDTLLMGVTGLMKKHSLGADYSDIPEWRLREAAEQGTAIHEEIEQYDDGVAVFASELIDEYRKLCLEYGLKSVESEYLVTDYELIASSIDKVYEAQNGDAVIVDIKTTAELHKRALQWQLGIYGVLFHRMNPDIQINGYYCLWIDKKKRSIRGFIPIEPVSESEVLALLDAERNGLLYIDENDMVDVSVAVPEKELATYVANASKIAELKAQIKEIELMMKQNDSRVLEYMEQHNLDKMVAPGGTFSRKASYIQVRVDSDKLKSLYPAVYDKVKKEVNVKSSLSFKAENKS